MVFVSDESNYEKPLALTYYSTSFFTLYLIPLVFKVIKLRCKSKGLHDIDRENIEEMNDTLNSQVDGPFKASADLLKLKQEVKEIFWLSLTFCFIWFLANYFYNYGLLYATITSSVVLSNTSPVWVYMISVSCLVPASTRANFSWIKAIMILVSLSGFGIIAIEDS